LSWFGYHGERKPDSSAHSWQEILTNHLKQNHHEKSKYKPSTEAWPMISHVLNFDSEGIGHCLYTEILNLTAIGPLEIARASNIEFNIKTQLWEVRSVKGEVLYTNASRQLCLEWEHQYFNQ